MSEEAGLDALVQAMKGSGLDFADPVETIRSTFNGMLATLPIADDISVNDVSLGGCSAKELTAPGVSQELALLYLHGGVYVSGTAEGYSGLAGELGRVAGAKAWALDYRLAPEHPFPAALDDAVSAYKALMEAGHKPEGIAIVGDSAGGGLTAAMLTRLRDGGLPMPAAAALLSPWIDLSCSGASYDENAGSDVTLTAAGLRSKSPVYLGGTSATAPEANAIYADLAGLPPILIHVGSREILLDDAVAFARKAGGARVMVELQIWPDMPHVWHAFHFMLPAGARATANVGTFLRQHLRPDSETTSM